GIGVDVPPSGNLISIGSRRSRRRTEERRHADAVGGTPTMSTIPDNSTAKPATAARIYDYLLGGVNNFPADRDVAEKLIAGMPHARDVARANRAFLGRAVR